ncbi:MAG: hypothetical protein MMC33_004254 [Icmadophila ericetorum]|nr:hypothetical protein [Icmadophila ericetorum]
MVFEESTFVLSKAPAKAAVEPAEPVVQDPSKKLEILPQSGPLLGVNSPEPDQDVQTDRLMLYARIGSSWLAYTLLVYCGRKASFNGPSRLEQSAPSKRTEPLSASKELKKVDSSQKVQQASPKREPIRPQWDTSLVNKARNAVRKPHQPQWSPAGAAARKARPNSAKSVSSWTPPRDSLSQNNNGDRSPARAGGSPVKHPSPWTLEGKSVLNKNIEDEDTAAEEARCDPKSLYTQLLRASSTCHPSARAPHVANSG